MTAERGSADGGAERFATALAGFEARVAKVTPEDLRRPTPCTDWALRDLVNHVLGELLWMPPLLEGQTIGEVGDRFEGDQLGGDVEAAWSAAAADASRAVTSRAGDQLVHLSYGDVPADSYVDEVTIDVLVHTWDLARALGVDDALDAGVVDFARRGLEGHAQELAASGMFAPPVDVPAGADPQTQLLAAVGRDSSGRG